MYNVYCILKERFNSSSHTRFDISGLLKIQTLLKVRQGQYKNLRTQYKKVIVTKSSYIDLV